MRRLSATRTLLGIVCLHACTSPATEPERSVPPDAQALVCNPVSFEPEASLTVYFGSVALPTAPRQATALLAVPRPGPSGQDEYFAKYGLWFRGDNPVTIEIADATTGAELNWEGRSRVVVTPTKCSPDPEQWNGIVGGYLVPSPQCLAVRVSSGDQSEIVTIGVGTACPGQDPPETAPP